MNPCIRCGKPTDADACTRCADRAAEYLADIADFTEAARAVAMGQSRRGPVIAGGSGSGLELNLSAAARLDAVQNALVGWCRIVAEEWSLQIAVDAAGRTMQGDPLAIAASWLSRQMGLVRGRDFAGDALAEIADARNVVVNLIDGAGGRHYLGPCGAQVEGEPEADCPVNCECHNGPHYPCSEPGGCGSAGCGRGAIAECPGDLYARDGSTTARCRACGSTMPVADRRAWLDETARATAHRAAHIADAYDLNVNTLRAWYLRGKLFPARKALPDGEQGPLALLSDARGRPLFLVGEVLDLARQDAERRADREAKRAIREAEAA